MSPGERLQAATELLGPLLEDGWVERLSPAEVRALHDAGVRAQDRLMDVLAALVRRMAEDGAELVDARGVPQAYEPGHR